MLIYTLFILGMIFLFIGLFYLKPQDNKEDKDFSHIERTSREMINQLEDAAENILAQIDNKSIQLKSLMLEADGLIKNLEKVKSSCLRADKGNKKPTPLEEKQQKILKLLEQGKELVEIAKIMKMGKGEIQLVLDLGKTGWKKVETSD